MLNAQLPADCGPVDIRRVRRHQDTAGLRIGDGGRINLLKYAAWLRAEWKSLDPTAPGLPASRCARSSRSSPSTSSACHAPSSPSAYETLKERARDRNRRLSQEGRDIGELPPVADPERRARALASFRAFCESYFPAAFSLAWSADHLKVIAKIERAVLTGGLFAHAMPRGSGKTTLTTAACLWAALRGSCRYIAMIAASADMATNLLANIKEWIETNPLLAADFPEVCYPIHRLENITIRQRGQTYRGEPTRIHWGADRIVLPTIPGSLASGAIIATSGMDGSRIRGLNKVQKGGGVQRPDLVMIDDPQTRESAWSLTQCQQREAILKGDILGMAGPGRKLGAILCCTVIRPGDLADAILDRKRNPEWQGERTKLIYRLPANEQLWEEYARIRAESFAADGDGSQATEFYRRNREAMDEGAEPAWPERYHRDELSATQHAMNLKIRDEAAFWAEYQNQPLPAAGESTRQLSATAIAAKCNGLDRGVVPKECHAVVASVDVHDRLLYWGIVALADGFRGAVLDWGTWPPQPTNFFSLANCPLPLEEHYPGRVQDAYLTAGLNACVDRLLSRTFFREEDRAELRVQKLLIDAHWGEKTELVKSFCRRHPQFNAVVLPSFGVSVKPGDILRVGRKPGGRFGPGWGIPPAEKGMLHVTFDADWGKSQLAQRLAVPLNTPGGFDLFGRDPRVHALLAEHCTAERAITVTRGEASKETWELLPNRDNHGWDNLVMCLIAGLVLGVKMPGLDQSRRRSGGSPKTLAEMAEAARKGR
jgi:hypothetical protein